MGCAAEPVPQGWQVWRGPVPTPLTQWAMDIRDHIDRYRYGDIAAVTTWEGKSVGAFKSHHTWTYRNGALVTGICIPGISLLIPKTQAAVGLNQDNLEIPDPTAAVYGAAPPESTDWKLVALSGLAGAGVVVLFLLAIKKASLGP